MNRFYQMGQTNWDLRVPVVRWAYRAMCKNLSAEMVPKTRSKVKAISLGNNPHAITPIIATVCKDQSKEIMQLHEENYMQIQEAI